MKAVGICPVSGWNVLREDGDASGPIVAVVLFEDGTLRAVEFGHEGPSVIDTHDEVGVEGFWPDSMFRTLQRSSSSSSDEF